jgi:flagellar biogenesis protein FliO
MPILRLLLGVILAVTCAPVRADVATAAIPPLPSTALGAEPVGNSGTTSVIAPGNGASAQPQGLDYPRVLTALGIVIGLILALRWLGRFFFPATTGRARSRAVEVLARSPLSPKQQVMLLRVGQRLLVVGDSGSQMSPLCQITDPDEVAALVGQLRDEKMQVPKRAFGTMFGRSQDAFETPEPAPIAAGNELREAEEESLPVATAREELNGLRDRVRLLAEQFKAT